MRLPRNSRCGKKTSNGSWEEPMYFRTAIAACAFLFAAPFLSAATLPSSGPSTAAAPAATSSRAIITSKLTPIKRFFPVFAPITVIAGVQMDVTICFTVKADGSVSDARVKNFHVALINSTRKPGPSVQRAVPKVWPKIQKITIRAIRKWKFSPRRINGKAVATPNVCQAMGFRS